VPAGPVNDVLAAIESPQAQARSMDAAVHHPLLGRLRQVGLPYKLSVTPAAISAPPPLLGEHSEQVLAELGYDPDEVRLLREAKVI
jgi:crotonobetainyl-CoA:carnitine CoA-transferase CaiB-like acyl-CoA transferase